MERSVKKSRNLAYSLVAHPIVPVLFFGATPIAKRIPPSQRGERKMDETAKAIAQAREQAKPDKPTSAEKSARDASITQHGQENRIAAPRRAAGPGNSPTAKRTKSGES